MYHWSLDIFFKPPKKSLNKKMYTSTKNYDTANQESNEKHIDASVKERPQTLLVPSEEICKRVLCNKHI